MRIPTFPIEKSSKKRSLIYSETKFDFVDCLMICYADVEGYEVITFDKKLNNYMRKQS